MDRPHLQRTHKRFRSRSQLRSPWGDRRSDLSAQLSRYLFPRAPDRAPDPSESTYVPYIGINGCSRTPSDDLAPLVESLLDAVHNLYTEFETGPIHRSSGGIDSSDEVKGRAETWNECLRTQASEFGSTTDKATIFVVSSHQVLSEILDDPLEYEFTEDDPVDEGGGIWEDELHLTSDVHALLAEQLLTSLKG